MSVAVKALRLDNLLQNYATCAKSHAISLKLVVFLDVQSYLVANLLTKFYVALSCNSFGHSDSCNLSRLADEDSTVIAVFRSIVEKELRNLRCLWTNLGIFNKNSNWILLNLINIAWICV